MGAVVLAAPALGAPPLADVLRLDTPVTGLESGVVIPVADGAFLEYVAVRPDGPDSLVDWTAMGSRFDAAGNLVWSLRPEALPVVFGPAFPATPPPDRAAGAPLSAGTWGAIAPLATDAAKAHARYSLETGAYRFGVVDAATAVPVFGYELSFAPAAELVFSIAAPTDVELALRHDHDDIALLGVDPSGALVFDAIYTSASFVDAATQAGRIQAASVAVQPTGYYLTAHIAEQLSVAGTGTPVPYRCAIVSLDSVGNVVWAGTFARSDAEPAADLSPDVCAFPTIAPDGALVYALSDLALGPAGVGLVGRTHLIKVLPDGSLGWATTFDGASLGIGGFAADGTHLLLAGTARPTATSSAGVVVRVDAASGTPTHEFRLPEEENPAATLAVVATSERHVYTARWVTEGTTPSTGALDLEVVRLDRELANPSGFRQPGGTWRAGGGAFDAIGLLVSEFDEESGEVRAFTVNEELAPLDAACARTLFEATPIAAGTPGLVATPLRVVLEPATVAAAPASTALTPAALPVQPLGVTATTCTSAAAAQPPAAGP